MIEAHGTHLPAKSRHPRAGLVSAGRNLAIALTAFIVACRALDRALPFPEVRDVTPKWEFFKAHRGDYEVVFIGSSRLYHQIIPSEFDASLSAAGVPVRSFNFALDGMWPPESYYMLRQLLLLHPPRLKWVVVELLDMRSLIVENSNTSRMMYWHDSRHTFLMVRDLYVLRRSWSYKWPFIEKHLWLWLQRFCNYGRAVDSIKARLDASLATSPPPGWMAASGFTPGPENGLMGKELEEYTAGVERLRASHPIYPMRAALQAELHDLITLVRETGAEPVFILSPTINPLQNRGGIPDRASVLGFGASDYPQLYNPELWFDKVHLNPTGAKLYTDLISRKFIETVLPSAKPGALPTPAGP